MWKWLCVFSSLTLQILCGKLVGDHICRTEESYTVNVTEYHVRNATVRNYEWCLNVPPRCSYYTIKKINDTRIAERNRSRIVEKCCPGYFERNDNCLPKCADCRNGICKEDTCYCTSGFAGINCDIRCNLGFWGPNCTRTCDCTSNSCNPINGSCLLDIHKNSYEENDVDITTQKLVQNELYEDIITTQTTQIISMGTTIDNAGKWYNNSVKLGTKQNTALPIFNSFSTSTQASTTNTYNTPAVDHGTTKKGNLTLNEYQIEVQNILYPIKKTEYTPNIRHNIKNDNGELLIPVDIQYDQIAKPLMQETTAPTTTLEEDGKIDSNKIPSREYYFINSISVSAATTVALILLALTIVTIKRKYKSKEKLGNKKGDVSTVAVYTTSIFHTPLPDPPTCENPSYLSPLECQNCLTEPTVKTCVVYNMNTSNQEKPDCKNYEYDYPPSSGSYRAASVIEPLEADINPRPLCIQSEPLYDEIPSRGDYDPTTERTPHGTQSVSLYMNTPSLRNFKVKDS